jgi:predicted KAP-like P-loop ATPase
MATDQDHYLTDYWTTEDNLRFSDFRPALFNILTQAQTPLTIGVFGPWGSGKTSLLRMLKEDVEKKRSSSLRAVWFTAWKYDRLLLAAGSDKVADKLGITPDMAQLLQREVQAQRLEQLASMEQFEATFKDALAEILGPDGRLVVFVDDLDRCLPEKAIEVLEAIKLFLEVPGTAFVLGMDRAVIERGIEARYGECFRRQDDERAEFPISGASYLQKIVRSPSTCHRWPWMTWERTSER